MEKELSVVTGKQGEYKVIGMFMSAGLTVYTPVVDIEGIDCILRNSYCRLIEIQIKTRNKNGDENRLFKIKDFQPHKNFFIACYFIDTNELWVIPSYKFKELSTLNAEGIRSLAMSVKNQIALSTYKDNLGIGLLKLGEMPERNKI